MSWKRFIPREIRKPVSSVISEVEDFVRPVTDPIRSGIAKIVPKEIKPYASTIMALMYPWQTGAAGFLGGTGMDAFFQKMMTDPDDEDTDVDWLKSAMTGIGAATKGAAAESRRLGTDKRIVDLEKANITDRGVDFAKEPLSQADYIASQKDLGYTNVSPADYAAYEASFDPNRYVASGTNVNETLLNRLNTGTAVAATEANPATLSNFLGTDVLQAAGDYFTPFDFNDATGLLDYGKELGSTLTAAQLISTPSQVKNAKDALKAAEAEYEAYLAQLDADTRASIEADRSARIAAYKEYMGLAGFSEEEINQALIEAGYLEEGGTAYAANGGRIGFHMGSQVEGPHRDIAPLPKGHGHGLESLLRELSRMKDAVDDEKRARIREEARIPSGTNTSKYESMLKKLSGMRDALDDELSARRREGARMKMGKPVEFGRSIDDYLEGRIERMDDYLEGRTSRVNFNNGTGGDFMFDRLQNGDYTGGDFMFDRSQGENGVQTGGKTDSMGIGNYLETEKIRSRWMDKIERMLQHKRANMQTNDPGLFGRMGNVLDVANIFTNERTWPTREEMRFPDMERRYRQTIQQMERDQANDDWKMMERTKNQVGGYLDMLDNRYANMKKGGRINYNMGTRRTPEGDPISPDVPAGMQMDLRGGGFIPLGTKPRADDVPAMVGKDEFVLNDRAVAGIGKMMTGVPDPRAGAKALYELQNQMEATV